MHTWAGDVQFSAFCHVSIISIPIPWWTTGLSLMHQVLMLHRWHTWYGAPRCGMNGRGAGGGLCCSWKTGFHLAVAEIEVAHIVR